MMYDEQKHAKSEKKKFSTHVPGPKPKPQMLLNVFFCQMYINIMYRGKRKEAKHLGDVDLKREAERECWAWFR